MKLDSEDDVGPANVSEDLGTSEGLRLQGHRLDVSISNSRGGYRGEVVEIEEAGMLWKPVEGRVACRVQHPIHRRKEESEKQVREGTTYMKISLDTRTFIKSFSRIQPSLIIQPGNVIYMGQLTVQKLPDVETALRSRMLAPAECGQNVATSGTGGRVKYAINLSGRHSNGAPVWLPIDATFPVRITSDWWRRPREETSRPLKWLLGSWKQHFRNW